MPRLPTERAVWLARHVLPHERALRGWLHRLRGMDFDVDDVVQETYAVLSELREVAHIGDPRAYVFQTARSIVLRQLRRSRVVEITALADIDDLATASEGDSPESQIAARQELAELARAIADLPPRCREAFRLRRVTGLTQAEVARTMGLSLNTVEKHMGRALRLLADRFGREGTPVRRTAVQDATLESKGHASSRDQS